MIERRPEGRVDIELVGGPLDGLRTSVDERTMHETVLIDGELHFSVQERHRAMMTKDAPADPRRYQPLVAVYRSAHRWVDGVMLWRYERDA